MEYSVKLDRFEGPYTKLLELIEERKLSITEITLGAVAEDYVAYVRSLVEKDYKDVSQFIVVASTLMLIKVKSLLPGVSFTEEEERQVKGLEKKLELYSLLVESSKLLSKRYGKSPLFFKKQTLSQEVIFIPSSQVEVKMLHAVAHLMMSLHKKAEHLKTIAVPELIRMEEVVERLLSRVKEKMTLHEVADGIGIKEKGKALIMSFLALLELIRLGRLDGVQEEAGGNIIISGRSSMLE